MKFYGLVAAGVAWLCASCSSGRQANDGVMMAANAGASGSTTGCTTQLPLATPECEACMRKNCCATISVCANVDCVSCVPPASANCTADADKAQSANLDCASAHCSPECLDSTSGGAGGASGSSGGSPAAGSGGGSTCDASCGSACCKIGEACVGIGGDAQCEKACAKASDCPGESCAPAVYAGVAVGPYICVPNDGAAYHGCMGLLTSCGSGYCCFTDGNMNQFCAKPCTGTDLAECGLFASCNSYSNANTTCAGTLGCGPTPKQ